MSKIEIISLTDEELSKLRGKLAEKGLKQQDLAELASISQSAIAQIMSGKCRLKYEFAERIYDALQQDPSLDFLRFPQRINIPDMPIETIEGGWDSLYQEYVQKLRSIYHSRPSDQKGILISELEELIRKYSQPNS